MLGNWDILGYSEADLHYRLSDAHLDAALMLAKGLSEGTYSRTYSHCVVIMSMVHHATELFLKYCIARAKQDVPTHHHIASLWAEFQRLYPDIECDFQPPFITVYLGYSEDQLLDAIRDESSPKKRNLGDQQLRYHTDRKGNHWPGAFGVDPDTYYDTVKGTQASMQQLHSLIENAQ